MYRTLLSLAFIQLVLIACPTIVFGAERPNIVFFIADDISQDDFGCYGHQVIKTPHTDRLAANGLRFDNAYLTTSSCSPSRCSIITGRYPHNTGAPELHVTLPDSQIRFPELLHQAGYYTVLSGKNHMFGDKDRAFDLITHGGGPGSSADWVQLVKDRPKDKPFFFWLASTDGHRDWAINDDVKTYNKEEVIIPPYMVDTEVTREDLTGYYHEVSRYDHYVGLVTAELKKQGVLDNTLIVVASDNGRPFPRCKSRLYDSGIKTPWVVHFPAMIKSAAVSKSLLSVIDLSATCLELAGVKIPECVQGLSFVPILKDPTATVREMVFSEHNWHVYKNHERMVRFGDFLYIKNNYPNQPNLCYESDTHYPAGKELWIAHAAGKTTWKQQQVFANPCPEEELFQVSEDSHQLTNLVANPEYAEALAQARSLLEMWTKQTGDTIPEQPTPNRHDPPRIESGKIIPKGKTKRRNPHSEMPGAAMKATEINHPGPITISK
jgi:arylsulfatase